MGRKSKPKLKEPCCDYGETNFGMIHEGFLKCEQFKSLPIGERNFLIICQVQAKTPKCRQCLYNHGKEEDKTYNENYFVFPAKHMEEYGINSSNGSKYLNRLIDKGFIEKVEYNKHRKKVNVYKFSTKWKNEETTANTAESKEQKQSV